MGNCFTALFCKVLRSLETGFIVIYYNAGAMTVFVYTVEKDYRNFLFYKWIEMGKIRSIVGQGYN